jgi:uncharacterized repeat protein (TIGR03943 family)
MQKLIARWLPAATLATWSAVLFFFHFSEQMKNMLAPEFRYYAFAAACVLALMAVVFVAFKADASCCSSAECGHGLSRANTGKLLTFLILLVPICVAAAYSPDNFSNNMLKNRRTSTDAKDLPAAMERMENKFEAMKSAEPKIPGPVNTKNDLPLPNKDGSPPAPAATQPEKSPTDYLTRTPEGYIMAEVLDLLYAAQDAILRPDFEGKEVQVIAQFMPDNTNNATGNRFKAVRMFMTCCAADARPVATLVEVEKMPAIPEMTWVKIIGKPSFPIEKGRRISVLQAERVEKTSPPEDQMLL